MLIFQDCGNLLGAWMEVTLIARVRDGLILATSIEGSDGVGFEVSIFIYLKWFVILKDYCSNLKL